MARTEVRVLRSLTSQLCGASSTAEVEVVLAMVPLGHPSLPLLEAAVRQATAPSRLVQIQTAADIPSPCNARGMVVVHSQG
eukprot:COSAG02_NODE_63061_length_264_cov_0.630303_1_plen_80_part_10